MEARMKCLKYSCHILFCFKLRHNAAKSSPKERVFWTLIRWFIFSLEFTTTCDSELWMLTLPLDLCQHFRGPRCECPPSPEWFAGSPRGHRWKTLKNLERNRHCGVGTMRMFGVDATVWKCSASQKKPKKELRQQENGCNKKRCLLQILTLEDEHGVVGMSRKCIFGLMSLPWKATTLHF